MKNIAKGDVMKLCEHIRELTYELNAAGETTNDLLANLIEALKEAPDNFQRWLSNQVDLWSMRKLDWKQDGSDLMEDAEIYYQETINTHR
jgi:cytochrome P450